MTVAEETQQKEKNTVSSNDSKTKVHLNCQGARKYLSGKREPISIRIDTGLYSVFKPLSKRFFGSTCNAVETYMISFIDVAESGVHFSDTAKPIQIDKIVIERKLRERRNLGLEGDAGTGERRVKCGFGPCKNRAVGKAIWLQENKVYDVCQKHLTEACSNSKLWKVIQS